MEKPDYAMGKRYADIMKTMWFTFLYCAAIPLGTMWSMIGLTIYYYADKHNVCHRRTIKESIGLEMSSSMIELLEFCMVYHSVI